MTNQLTMFCAQCGELVDTPLAANPKESSVFCSQTCLEKAAAGHPETDEGDPDDYRGDPDNWSSAQDEWQTPPEVWTPIFDQWKPTFDLAASAENALCKNYFTRAENAFAAWQGLREGHTIWCNPPYSQSAGPLARWVGLGFVLGMRRKATTLMLLPADTSTRWFHAIFKNPMVDVEFFTRRIRHVHPRTGKRGGSPKFGSLLAIFHPAETGILTTIREGGQEIELELPRRLPRKQLED